MIGPCTALLAPKAAYLGAKAETLFDCYGDLPQLASFWQSDNGAVMAFFAGRLTVCGEIDAEELSAFADFVGACEIEGDALLLPTLSGFSRTEHPIMACAAAETAPLPEPCEPGEGFAVLCAADAAFGEHSDRLEWLSDMRRRINRSRGGVFASDGAAVVVTARSESELIIGAVACRKECRGNSHAARLVRAVSALAASEGRTAVTAAKDEGLADYYGHLGFCRVGTLTLLTRGGAV